eukprot:5930555-Pleurochrysis_carterae.AAC.1
MGDRKRGVARGTEYVTGRGSKRLNEKAAKTQTLHVSQANRCVEKPKRRANQRDREENAGVCVRDERKRRHFPLQQTEANDKSKCKAKGEANGPRRTVTRRTLRWSLFEPEGTD